jgi:hypothetical protein
LAVRTVDTTGTNTAASLIPTGSSVPTNGVYLPAANTVAIATNGSERARIDSSGGLLVGTSSALTGYGFIPQFQLAGTSAGTSSILIHSEGSAAFPTFSRANAGNTAVINNDPILDMRFFGWNGTGFVRAASIECRVDGTPGASDMPGRLVFSTTAAGASSPTEQVRLTNTGALLVGTTATPTGAASGAVVAQDRMVISSAEAGRHQVIAGDTGNMTETTGTTVFKFRAPGGGATARSGYVKLAIANRSTNNTPSNSPAAEYAFQLHRTSTGACSLNGATTIFQFTYVYATHVAFADLGSGECTVTLTNPTAQAQTGSYKVEVLTQAGIWTLDSVTTT